MMSQNWLARFADNIFWLARYMERAENLVRTIGITETHARDRQGTQDWTAILDFADWHFRGKRPKITTKFRQF